MSREKEAYRDNLEQVLKFTDGTQLLSITAVAKFTGRERHTVRRLYPFKNGYISAATLARELS